MYANRVQNASSFHARELQQHWCHMSVSCLHSPDQSKLQRLHTLFVLLCAQAARPTAILDLIRSAESFQFQTPGMTTDKSVSRTNGQQNSSSVATGPVPRSCDLCGYITSQPVCKACLLLEGLNKGRPRQGVERTKKKTNQDPIMPPSTATAASIATAATSARCCGAGGCSGKCQGDGQCGGGGSCGGGGCSSNAQAENTRMASQVMAGVMAGVGSRVAVAAYGVAPGLSLPGGKGHHTAAGNGGGGGDGSCGGGGSGGGRGGCGSCDAPVAKDACAGDMDVDSGSSLGADAVLDESRSMGNGQHAGSDSIGVCLTTGLSSLAPTVAVADMDESASRPGFVHTAAQSSPSGTAAGALDLTQAVLDLGVPVKTSRGLPLEIKYED